MKNNEKLRAFLIQAMDKASDRELLQIAILFCNANVIDCLECNLDDTKYGCVLDCSARDTMNWLCEESEE